MLVNVCLLNDDDTWMDFQAKYYINMCLLLRLLQEKKNIIYIYIYKRKIFIFEGSISELKIGNSLIKYQGFI